jgi:hypothetical protein
MSRPAPTQVAPGVHRLGDHVVNFYLIEDPDGLVLVDAGTPAHLEQLRTLLAEPRPLPGRRPRRTPDPWPRRPHRAGPPPPGSRRRPLDPRAGRRHPARRPAERDAPRQARAFDAPLPAAQALRARRSPTDGPRRSLHRSRGAGCAGLRRRPGAEGRPRRPAGRRAARPHTRQRRVRLRRPRAALHRRRPGHRRRLHRPHRTHDREPLLHPRQPGRARRPRPPRRTDDGTDADLLLPGHGEPFTGGIRTATRQARQFGVH